MGRKTSQVPSKVNKELAALNHRGEDYMQFTSELSRAGACALLRSAWRGFFFATWKLRGRSWGCWGGVGARESGVEECQQPWVHRPWCCSSACTFRSNCPRCFSMRRESASRCVVAISTPARRGHGGPLSGNCTKIHGNSHIVQASETEKKSPLPRRHRSVALAMQVPRRRYIR